MPRQSTFDLIQYVSDKSRSYLILRLVDFKAEDLTEKPYRVQPIIHDSQIKKYLIYADTATFQKANQKIGNAFVNLFSRKINEQKKGKKTIIDYFKSQLPKEEIDEAKIAI